MIAAGHTGVKGKKAGTLGTRGYVQMWLYGGQYTAHRLAWFYVNGAWPTKDIDHIDRNRSNNAIANLREATKSENARNRAISGAAKSNRKRIPQFALYHF